MYMCIYSSIHIVYIHIYPERNISLPLNISMCTPTYLQEIYCESDITAHVHMCQHVYTRVCAEGFKGTIYRDSSFLELQQRQNKVTTARKKRKETAEFMTRESIKGFIIKAVTELKRLRWDLGCFHYKANFRLY